jgi:2-amino-4-hydroxy-6-hydroxymethyldihydropteridine diphosphokinase
MAVPQAALIALGSNMGDRLATLRAALERLEAAGEIIEAVSGVYETAPMYVTDQPIFYNACARLRTRRAPHALLALMLEVEAGLGRVRTLDQGPRTLDLDLLACGDAILDDATLCLPHPDMARRHFVLAPLVEVAPPGWSHPVSGLSAAALLAACVHDPTLRRLDEALWA